MAQIKLCLRGNVDDHRIPEISQDKQSFSGSEPANGSNARFFAGSWFEPTQKYSLSFRFHVGDSWGQMVYPVVTFGYAECNGSNGHYEIAGDEIEFQMRYDEISYYRLEMVGVNIIDDTRGNYLYQKQDVNSADTVFTFAVDTTVGQHGKVSFYADGVEVASHLMQTDALANVNFCKVGIFFRGDF